MKYYNLEYQVKQIIENKLKNKSDKKYHIPIQSLFKYFDIKIPAIKLQISY